MPTDPLLDTLERLQEQLPPHLARRDLAELAVLLRYAERGSWAFAVYNTVPVRDEVAGVLRQLLAPLPVYDFTLSPERPNPLAYLKDIPAGQERGIVFFFDLEQTGGAVWDYLEMQRENLAVRALNLVFWINRQAWQEGLRRAPNFWSQRSGVFDFTIEAPGALTEVRGAWAGQPVRLESPEDWERQMRLFGGLLREYEAEAAPPAARAELHGKIAYLLYFAGRNNEAAGRLQQQLELARAAGDRRQQVEAMNNLGRVAEIQQGRLAALAWYEQALAIAGDEPRARAESLQNMAAALLWEGEAVRARAMLDEALDLFRAVGDRLGEANTFLALGRLARSQGDLEEARARGEAALAIYRTQASPWNTALALWDLARLERAAGDRAAARTYYREALRLLERIGAPSAAVVRAEIQALD